MRARCVCVLARTYVCATEFVRLFSSRSLSFDFFILATCILCSAIGFVFTALLLNVRKPWHQ